MTPAEQGKSAQEHAKEHHEAQQKAAEEMERFEQSDEVPKDPQDWPDGKAKYITYGLSDDSAYGEGTTGKLGPADVVHHDDGSTTVGGEEVDPSDYKGEPIKGGVIEQIEASKQRYADEDGASDDGSSDDDSSDDDR